MKNLLPFLFAFVLVLSGCKNDEEDDIPKTTSELLQGSWPVVSQKFEYYNESGAKIYEETTAYVSKAFVNDKNIKYVFADGFTYEGVYTTTELSEKKYISFSYLSSNQSVEIITLTDKTMVWKIETINDAYFENSIQKQAAKSIGTIHFQKE